FVKQAASKIEKKQTCAGGENRAPETHAEFSRAENRGAGANRERDPRTFAEITGCQSLRPHPVMCFVEFEIGRYQHRQSNTGQRSDEQPNCARLAHSPGLTTKLGCRS